MNLVLLSGLGLVGYGAYEYYRTQFAVLQKSEIGLSGIRIKERSPDNVTLAITLKVKNNSEQEFVISKYDLMFHINNHFVGSIRNSDVDRLVKGFGGETKITFDFSFNPKDFGLLDVLYTLIRAQSNSGFTIRGNIVVRKGFISITAPIDVTYRLSELLKK